MKYIIASLILFSHLSIYSQSGTISGRISSEEGPLEYVNVLLKDTRLGSTTDTTGRFEIQNAPYGEYELIASILGFDVQNISISVSENQPHATFQITLKPVSELLDEIVVSVPGGRLQKDVVVNVEQKSLEELHTTSSNTLAESITNLTGVSQNSTGNSIGKPVIRGLTSNRVVTYAQGTRIENQQWGAEHGLGVSPNGVKSVEVIKGPASLLYGSDAIGGVLYFVDEGFTDRGFEGIVETGYFTNSRTTQNRVGVKTDLGLFKLNVFGGYNSAADYRIPEGERIFNTRFNEKNAKVALGIDKGTLRSKLTYTYLNNFFGIPADMPFSEGNVRNFVLPFQDVTQHNLAFENNFRLQGADVDLILGYAVNDRQEFNEVSDAPDLHLNLDVYSYNIKISNFIDSDKVDVVLGSQGLHQVNRNLGTVFLIPDGQSTDFGFYSLFNLDLLNNLDLQAGARFDSRNIQASSVLIDGVVNFSDFNNTFNTFNYSFGTKYALNNFNFRFNVASGFRAPNTSELLSNGEHGGVGRIEVGDINLESENAIQIDFSAGYDDGQFSFFVNPFFNNIDNYIFIAPTNQFGEGNLPIFEYLQEDARLFGGEANVGFQPKAFPGLTFSSALAITFGEDSEGNSLPLIPPVNFNSRLSYDLNIGKTVRLNSAYVQVQNFLSQNRVSEFELPNYAYTLVNVGISASYDRFSLDFAVKNLFNTTYTDHLSRLKTTFEDFVIPNPGRDVTLTLRANF